jgi:ribonuclease VapC
MVVDPSALIAILENEPEKRHFLQLMQFANQVRMSAASLVEVSIVIQNRAGDDGISRLDDLIVKAGIEVVPVSLDEAILARDAHRRFGKGRHGARLNLGDCFSYALAKRLGEPLLFKGNDFIHTDIEAAR